MNTPPLFDSEYPDELHYMPADDLREHEPCGSCWCKPQRETHVCVHGVEFVWTHRAADGRDYYPNGIVPLQ